MHLVVDIRPLGMVIPLLDIDDYSVHEFLQREGKGSIHQHVKLRWRARPVRHGTAFEDTHPGLSKRLEANFSLEASPIRT
jgi:hypothetical protein